jgi:hypothetical protein
MLEKHVGIPELSKRWGFSEDVIRDGFLRDLELVYFATPNASVGNANT